MNSRQRQFSTLLSQLYNTRCPGQFWNLVRRTRANATDWNAISLNSLFEHFRAKFAAPERCTEANKQALQHVQQKYDSLCDTHFANVTLSESRVTRMIRALKRGTSPGIDGISAEHLFFSIGTTLPFHLSLLLTLCLRFGTSPTPSPPDWSSPS